MTRACVLVVSAEDERWWAAGEARRFAASLGFSREEQARLAVCVAELASNAVKYGGGGRIEVSEVREPAQGCRVRAEDEGPGIAEFDTVLQDGFSEGRLLTPDVPAHERRGLGLGLGAVARLMSEVRLWPRPGRGLLVDAVLWRAIPRAL